MSSRPTLSCADCGKPMWTGRGTLPQGEARCRECRRLNPAARPSYPCAGCGKPCKGKRCMRCHAEHRTIRAADDNRLVRKQREAAAPGLGYAAQKRLLSKWKRQGKRCTYCEALADTIDHAVPLVRGGTNHEGNLVPACRACNSSKAGWTIAEWRTGKRLPRMAQPIPWKRATAKPTKPEPVPLSAVCQLCGTAFTPRRTGTKYCGTDCAVRANANSARFRYHAMRRAARIHHTDPAMRQGKVRTSAA